MKLALARAMLWFFASFITSLYMSGFDLKGESLFLALCIGVIFASAIFLGALFSTLKKEQRQRDKERQRQAVFDSMS